MDLHDNYWAGAEHHVFLVSNHPESHCAGVMLLNLQKFREDNLSEKFLQDLKENRMYAHYNEEKSLQSICKNKIITLPFRYNVPLHSIPSQVILANHSRIKNLMQEINNIIVLHYSGETKPWKTDKVEFFNRYIGDLHKRWWDFYIE